MTIESASTTAGITTGQIGGGMQQSGEGMGQPPANGNGMQ